MLWLYQIITLDIWFWKYESLWNEFRITFSNIPINSKIFTQQSFIKQEFALKELIKKCPLSANNILVFDTGLQARATF